MSLELDLTTIEKRKAANASTSDSVQLAIGFADYSAKDFEGDDILLGPQDGVNLEARLHDGNDTARLYSGFNRVNTNAGNDKVFINGGTGFLLGGSDNDTIEIRGGEFAKVNGNSGSDFITNFNGFSTEIRGGSGNDILVNEAAGIGIFYGDNGSDIFAPSVASNVNNLIATTYMIIKDFEPELDQLDLSKVGGAEFLHSGNDTLIRSATTGQFVAKIENILF